MGYFAPLEHPRAGTIESLGPPLRIEGVELVAARACSEVDGDAAAILREAGLDASEIAKLGKG
jgi:crotonobetainyl-CoA:carnitine CoA-transferase CaiB-like acyl-CoA transferase